jgi:hypothetical protein
MLTLLLGSVAAMAGSLDTWLGNAFGGIVVGESTKKDVERVLGEPDRTDRNGDNDLLLTYHGGTMPGGSKATTRVFTLLEDGDRWVVVAAEVRSDDKLPATTLKGVFGKADEVVNNVRHWCGSARHGGLYFVAPVENKQVWSVGVISAKWLRESNSVYRVCHDR